MTRARFLPLLGLTLMLAASGAAAQSHHDSNADIDVASVHAELLDRENKLLLTGDVKITQAEMVLNAERVVLTYTGEIQSGSPELSRLDASGGVRVTRPDQTASSQYAVYDLNRHVITMIGGVTLTQGPNVVRGSRLSINLDSGRATIDGSGVGAPGTQSSGGRVTGHFSVPKRDKTPGPTPTPTPQ